MLDNYETGHRSLHSFFTKDHQLKGKKLLEDVKGELRGAAREEVGDPRSVAAPAGYLRAKTTATHTHIFA